MRKIISLICLLLPILAHSEALQLRPDAPDKHQVVKGDTLWGISALFYKDPWKWPEIWGINKETIKDPHWIYPGDVIVLDRSSATLHVGETSSGAVISSDNPNSSAISEHADSPRTVWVDGVEKLSPRIRPELSVHDAIPTIPFKVIQPFLSQPLVMEEDLSNTPTLIAFEESRVILATDQTGYATGLTEDMGNKLQVYRAGKAFIDPDTQESLGREAIYLGDVDVKKFGEVSTVVATHSKQEINRGDHLIAPSFSVTNNYLPRAPDTSISATVISIYDGVSQAGQNSVVTLNKGERDGLQVGHVLALFKHSRAVKHAGEKYVLPDERYGLVVVFRIFHKVSYALVMDTRFPVHLLDAASTP